MHTFGTSLGRFSQLVFLILICLEEGPTPVDMLKENLERNGSNVLQPGTLYRALSRLEQRGWIAAIHGRDSAYHLTESGEYLLERHRIDGPAHNAFFKERSMKERTMRLVTWIVRLYPRVWRTRYEAEMLALLETHTITFWTILDLLMGVLDARLDPYYRSEKSLFSFKNLRMATLGFLAALALAMLCALIWDIQVQRLPSFDMGGFYEPLIQFWYRSGYLFILAPVFIASNVLIAFASLKQAIATRQWRRRTLLLGALCFALPVVVLIWWLGKMLSIVSSATSSGFLLFPLFWSGFITFTGLESLMGYLFLSITLGKKAIAVHNRRQLWLIGCTDLLLILLGWSLYLFMNIQIPLINIASLLSMLTDLTIILFPFTAIATIFLKVACGKMSRQALRVELVFASMMMLGLVTSLLTSIAWEIFSWARMVQGMGFWFFLDVRYPLMTTIGMAVATAVAFAALRRGFSALTTPVVPAEENPQLLPPQVQ